MERLPRMHIVADLNREKDRVQRIHAKVLLYDKALRLERSSISKPAIKCDGFLPSFGKHQWSKRCKLHLTDTVTILPLLLHLMTPIHRWYRNIAVALCVWVKKTLHRKRHFAAAPKIRVHECQPWHHLGS